jgi:hypothetical protein
MDKLDDPNAIYLITMVIILSLNLIFINSILYSFKTYFICYTWASISAIMYELGKKSKNYCRIHDISFWKLHDMLKNEISKKYVNASQRYYKK